MGVARYSRNYSGCLGEGCVGASGSGKVVMAVVVVVACNDWDRLYKGGSCNSCTSARVNCTMCGEGGDEGDLGGGGGGGDDGGVGGGDGDGGGFVSGGGDGVQEKIYYNHHRYQ